MSANGEPWIGWCWRTCRDRRSGPIRPTATPSGGLWARVCPGDGVRLPHPGLRPHGGITRGGQSIVCLPARIVVSWRAARRRMTAWIW
ncbi:MAG: hypothetical protein ACLTYN_03650 [Dysosmobacter welbionis]